MLKHLFSTLKSINSILRLKLKVLKKDKNKLLISFERKMRVKNLLTMLQSFKVKMKTKQTDIRNSLINLEIFILKH